jgi:hypothetical protein
MPTIKKKISKKASSKKNFSYAVPTGTSKVLKNIGKRSAKKAIRESKAMNLTITYMEKGILYSEKPDGTKIKLK